MEESLHYRTCDISPLRDIVGTFALVLEKRHYVSGDVPGYVIRNILEQLRSQEVDVKEKSEYHTTVLFPKFSKGKPCFSLQHAADSMERDPPKTKKEVQELLIAFVKEHPEIHCTIGDHLVITENGELCAIEIFILNKDFPHEPKKVYHITLWSNSNIPSCAPVMSNTYLQDAKRNSTKASDE